MFLRSVIFSFCDGAHPLFFSSLLLTSSPRLQVMVTAGGNQAFAMVALAVLDPGDRVLLVRPKLWWVLWCWLLCLN